MHDGVFRHALCLTLSALPDETVSSIVSSFDEKSPLLACISWDRSKEHYKKLSTRNLDGALRARFFAWWVGDCPDFPLRMEEDWLQAFLNKRRPRGIAEFYGQFLPSDLLDTPPIKMMEFAPLLSDGYFHERDCAIGAEKPWNNMCLVWIRGFLEALRANVGKKSENDWVESFVPLYVSLDNGTIVSKMVGGLPENVRLRLKSASEASKLLKKSSAKSLSPQNERGAP